MNICGCLVHVIPERQAELRPVLEAIEGVDVHAETEDGRFVVVVEDTGARRASETIMEMHQIPGVVSLTLTYHHFEDAVRVGGLASSCPQKLAAEGQTHDNF